MEWPFGTYTLVKPKAGCPTGWLEGWRHQDMEDRDNENGLAYDHHFYGKTLLNKFLFKTLFE